MRTGTWEWWVARKWKAVAEIACEDVDMTGVDDGREMHVRAFVAAEQAKLAGVDFDDLRILLTRILADA